MKMVKYKFIEGLTSDVMFEAYGKNLQELFANAAEAMFSVICEIKEVKAKYYEEFEMKAENASELMVNWLQGLIAIVDTEEMFFSKFTIKEIDETHVIAKLGGESIRPELGGTVVKAVTNYGYKFEKTKKGYKVRVSVDI